MNESTVPEERDTSITQTRDETRTITPLADIFELPDALVVIADMPGVEKEDVEVRVEDDLLTLAGKVKPQSRGDVLYREFQLLNYFRRFKLGEQVDQAKIQAGLKNGVLTVQLPKAEAARPRKITVNVAS